MLGWGTGWSPKYHRFDNWVEMRIYEKPKSIKINGIKWFMTPYMFGIVTMITF